MKKIFTQISILAAILFANLTADAQCTGERYNSFVFPGNPTLTSNIQYGSNLSYNGTATNLKIDVYEPLGDTIAERPLIIMAHGGSFVGGSKTGTDVVPLCKDLAKLGYVVASMQYRLGMNNFPFPGPDSSDATEAVMRAVQDARAAVRFFRKSAADSNAFRIDPLNIYFAGVSAGGFVALQLAYLDEMNEIPAFVDTTLSGLGGGIEGNSGNPGYSSEVKAIINICGALGDTAWMKAGDEPVLNFHGTNDGTVPYGSATITLVGLFPIMPVDGSFSVDKKADQLGITNCFEIYEGQDHVPHASNASYYDTTLVIMRNFLRHYQCNVPLVCSYNGPIQTGIEENITNELLSVFPNPAKDVLNFQWQEYKGQAYSLRLLNSFGQVVFEEANLRKGNVLLNTASFATGLYFMQIVSEDGMDCKRVVLE